MYFLECWDTEPDNRPTINQVLERFKAVIIKTENYQPVLNLQSTSTDEQNFISTDNYVSSNTKDLLHGEMSQFIENFDNMNTKEMVLTNETFSPGKNLSKIVND